jgi:asparagine N-glycosylation enzyme membrane subunit Stt3
VKDIELWILLTAPFNISIEGDIFGNVIIVLIIFGLTELYLRVTHRDRLILDIFIGGVLGTYAVTAFVYFFLNGVGAGTSIVGFSVLAMFIGIVFFDLSTWLRKSFEDRKVLNLIAAPFVIIPILLVLLWLVQALFAMYIVGNESAIYHAAGGIMAYLIVELLIRLRGVTSMAETIRSRQY